MQYAYYSKAAQMSADLKRVAHDVRTRRPEMFAMVEFKDTSMDGDGKVSTNVRRDSKAIALDGKYRHALSRKRD